MDIDLAHPRRHTIDEDIKYFQDVGYNEFGKEHTHFGCQDAEISRMLFRRQKLSLRQNGHLEYKDVKDSEDVGFGQLNQVNNDSLNIRMLRISGCHFERSSSLGQNAHHRYKDVKYFKDVCVKSIVAVQPQYL